MIARRLWWPRPTRTTPVCLWPAICLKLRGLVLRPSGASLKTRTTRPFTSTTPATWACFRSKIGRVPPGGASPGWTVEDGDRYMKALLICPADRPAVRVLAQDAPLAARHAFGKPLIVHWLEHLAARGTKKVFILASDRLDQIRRAAGDGRRFGLRLEFVAHPRELSPEEARHAFRTGEDWLREPNDVFVMDHFP